MGWSWVCVDVYAAFLGFGEKLGQRTDAEGVIGCSLMPLHIEVVLGDYFAVLRRDPVRIADIPTKTFKEGIDEGLSNVGFFDTGRVKRLPIGREILAQFRDFIFGLFKCLAHSFFVTSTAGPAAPGVLELWRRQLCTLRSVANAANQFRETDWSPIQDHLCF
jgi:hypothetical protein